ncbi:glycosyltransferase family 4 protein [uncultured Porphyromonas sp.]|uniref:glycosyltransferase family 4 protein n=1 Tax=uncultured Porphyromonas sp. TaxID=159274 RepID=UPI0026247AD1|nr:glycosyltransferase family 4 protein [uncultured Porphyromonas sp.]
MVTNEPTAPRGLAFVVNQIRTQGPLFVVRDIIAGLPEGYYKPYIIQLCSLEPQGEAMADELQAMGCEIIELGFTRGQLELFPKSAARLLDECLRHYDITLVHSHTYQPDIVSSYLSHRYILLSTQHNIAKLDFTYGKGRLLGSYMCRRLMRALARHREVVCVSHVCRDYYRKQLPTKVSVYVAPNGIDNALFTPPGSAAERVQLRRQLDLPELGYIITYCGSLTKLKDPELILRALRRLKRRHQLPNGLHLLFLGKGPLESHCRQLAKPLGEQVQFVGFTSRVSDYLRASDALITASHSEGFGLNVIEGIASGCVVIHSDLPIFGEILERVPQMTDLRFGVGCASQCADCILKAPSVTFDRQEALEMGHLYGRQRMALQYHRIYQQLLRKYLR